jgi:hypothetical protein
MHIAMQPGLGEQQAAEKLVEAGQLLAREPQAMQLRYFAALHDIASERSSTIVCESFGLRVQILCAGLLHFKMEHTMFIPLSTQQFSSPASEFSPGPAPFLEWIDRQASRRHNVSA